MALVVASPTPVVNTDPTDELKAALKDFETALLDDQRSIYTASTVKPDAESVTLFVADLAAKNQGAHGKFLWRRLCPFLEATRQFTGIVNTFVSSNPAIAALVWGGVRTTILAANNVASYFDRIASLLMEVGRISPTFTEFGQLYTDHAGLQQALCGYYTLVVKLCTKILKDSQRNRMSHIYSSFFNPFESEFKPFLDELSASKSSVRDQISLAAKQAAVESSNLLELESKANKIYRLTASKFWSDARQENEKTSKWRAKQIQLRNAEIRDKIKRRLSEVDHFKAWRLALQPRVPGTAEWFVDHDDFRRWRATASTTILHVQGTIGVGKTVFVANIVAHLLQHKEAADCVAFHFCRSDEERSLEAKTILGTLARQIWATDLQKMEQEALDRFYKDVEASDIDGLAGLLLQRFSKDSNYYIIVDGLDECPDTEISSFQRAISKVCTGCTGVIKFLCSARPHLNAFWPEKMRSNDQIQHFRIQLTESIIQGDIDKYIDIALDRCLEDGSLKLNDPRIVLRIAQVLKEGSNGMFLWTRFFVSELCSCFSDHEILEALKQPPQGLAELLDRIIARVKNQKSAEHALRTLEYCGVAKRPLLTQEMQEALSVCPGQQSLDRRKMPTDMHQVISACRGLVFVDEINDTVHYVHHSLKEHLFAQTDVFVSEFQEGRSDLALGYTCLIYLNFSDFQRQLTKTYACSNMPIQPLEMGLLSTTASGTITGKIARMLLSNQSQLHNLTLQELNNKTQDIIEMTGSSRRRQDIRSKHYCFLDYARAYWIYHLSDLDASTESAQWSLFARAMHSDTSPATKPWQDVDSQLFLPQIQALFPQPSICWAIQNSHSAILTFHHRMILESLETLFWASPAGEAGAELFSQTLSWTLCQPNLCNLVKILLEAFFLHPSRSTAIHDLDPERRILDALSSNNAEALALFSKYDDVFRNAAFKILQRAISSNEYAYVKMILGCWLTLKDERSSPTLLQRALMNNSVDIRIVTLLLSVRAEANPNNDYPPPLILASQQGNFDAVSELLHAGVDPNLQAGNDNALIEAVHRDHIQIVEKLVSFGAALDCKIQGTTPLMTAANRGCLEIVEILLDRGADVNQGIESTGRTPLTTAVYAGQLEVLRRLLAAGAQVDFSSSQSPTALIIAVQNENKEMVRCLIEGGADVNLIWGRDVSAVNEALRLDRRDIASVLNHAGARPMWWAI